MINEPSNISESIFDVIIIGAGINGAGIARDAAMRGLSVLLLDKGDVCAGTTSWSTRLIHGGLRYLEYGDLGLVYESLREREILFYTAFHLVSPLPLLMPIYEGRKRSPFKIRVGMIAYDVLALHNSLPRHRMLRPAEVLKQMPSINRESLLGGTLYYDAQVEFAERLVVENVLSAKEHGATVFTYTKVEKLIVRDQQVCGVECVGTLSGETLRARSRMVVNASGPWVDEVLASAGHQSPPLIGGTKGSHLIVTPFKGAPSNAVYVEAKSDHRPFFIIPWNGKYLIGTTDIRYQGDLDKVQIDEAEIDYLLSETNAVIPGANLARDSILYTYSGIRPLAYSEGEDEPHITRSHFIRAHPNLAGLISIVGGKLTTYRSLAEQTVNLIFRAFRRRRPQCTTAELPLPGVGGRNLKTISDRIKRIYGLTTQTSERLPRIYGSRASDVLQIVGTQKQLLDVFDDETGAIGAEVVFAFRHELAQTLGDILLRRTMVGLNSSLGVGADEAVATIAHRYVGWSEDRARAEIRGYRAYLKRFQVK